MWNNFSAGAINLKRSVDKMVYQYLVSAKEVNQGILPLFKAWSEVVIEGS